MVSLLCGRPAGEMGLRLSKFKKTESANEKPRARNPSASEPVVDISSVNAGRPVPAVPAPRPAAQRGTHSAPPC